MPLLTHMFIYITSLDFLALTGIKVITQLQIYLGKN